MEKAMRSNTPRTFQPAFEGLEDRCLMAAGVAARLALKGVSEAAATAKAILTGKKVDWPFLAVKWQPMHYFTDIQVVGGLVKADIQVSHGAFALVWQGNP
jgi:hypothetical protein